VLDLSRHSLYIQVHGISIKRPLRYLLLETTSTNLWFGSVLLSTTAAPCLVVERAMAMENSIVDYLDICPKYL
jgi:hypothetical protein